MSAVFLNLPWPPSANHSWRQGGGAVFKSAEYKAFKKSVNGYVLEHRIRRHWTRDRLAVGIVCYPPNLATHDIDNRVKTTLDAIVTAGVIVDDSHIDLLVVARGAIVKKGGVHVRIEELATLEAGLDWRTWFSSDGSAPIKEA